MPFQTSHLSRQPTKDIDMFYNIKHIKKIQIFRATSDFYQPVQFTMYIWVQFHLMSYQTEKSYIRNPNNEVTKYVKDKCIKSAAAGGKPNVVYLKTC